MSLWCRVQTPAKYHGLVNSVLQVLFMTEDFKERVKSHTWKNAETEHIDRELRDLFNDLEKYDAHTQKITNKLKIENVYEQRDAAEHYEKILRLTSPEASKIFHGALVNWSTCQRCNTQSESEAGFWHLPLPLVQSDKDYSVEKGLKDFFSPTDITGENQLYCEKCDQKCDAALVCEVKHHPEVLVLLLKRFEFDYSLMTYVKIDCAVNVPDTLQTPQNQFYELYAIVEHLGELRYGHYISKIKSDGRWYIFDDLDVSVSDYEHFQLDPTEKSQTAYLLFYRKKTGAGTSQVDNKKHDTLEASQIDTDKKQKKETRVNPLDVDKTNIKRKDEERIASSQGKSCMTYQENSSKWQNNDNNNVSIQIPGCTEANMFSRSTFERQHFDERVTNINACGHIQRDRAVRTQQSSNQHSSYDNWGQKCFSQKSQDQPNTGVHGFSSNRRSNGYETVQNEQPWNSVRSDPGPNYDSFSRQHFKRQTGDVYRGKQGDMRDQYQLGRRVRPSLNFDLGGSECKRERTRSEGFAQKTNPQYASQDAQLDNFGRQVRSNSYYKGNEGLKQNERGDTYSHSSQQHVQEEIRSIERALERHTSRERHQVLKQDIHSALKHTERSQQKGPGSGQRESPGQPQRNQRMSDHSDRLTSRDYPEQNAKSQNGGRGRRSSLRSPSNKCHNPENAIDYKCEDIETLSVEEDITGEQRREGKKQTGPDSRQSSKGCSGQRDSEIETQQLKRSEADKKPKKRKWYWRLLCIPRKNRRSIRNKDEKRPK